jgi:hypothetical protein
MSPLLETFANASLRGFRAGGGGPAGSYELISTTISSGVGSVTFDVTGLGSTYKHLQVRQSLRTNTAQHIVGSQGTVARVTLNGDGGANYNLSVGYSSGNSSTTYNTPTGNNAYWPIALDTFSATSSTVYANSILDFIDCFSTNKFKSVKALLVGLNDYQTSSWFSVALGGGQWQNTAALTSITITGAANLLASSRLSLYGYKAV